MSPPDARSNESTSEPTTEELVAMAYVDGELDEGARLSFEARLAQDPELCKEVAEYRSLQVLARSMAPPEPMDHEWARLDEDPIQRSLRALGGAGLLGGTVGLMAWSIYRLTQDEEPGARLVLALIFGLLVLLLATIRGRMRTYHLDPYRNIKR